MTTYTSSPLQLLSGNRLTGAIAADWYNILKAITDPWTSFTPTWTGTSNPVIGNGTLAGAYIQVGKLVAFRINIVAGSTTTFGTGAYSLGGLPATSNATTGQAIGIATFNDSSVTTNRYGAWTAWQNSGTSIALGDSAAGRWSATAPFTPASGDQFTVLGLYEAT